MSKKESNIRPANAVKPLPPPGPPEPNDFQSFVEDYRKKCIEIMAIPYHLLGRRSIDESIKDKR